MSPSSIPLSLSQVLGPLRRVSPEYAAAVEEVFALVAYEAPQESPMRHFMGAAQREVKP